MCIYVWEGYSCIVVGAVLFIAFLCAIRVLFGIRHTQNYRIQTGVFERLSTYSVKQGNGNHPKISKPIGYFFCEREEKKTSYSTQRY